MTLLFHKITCNASSWLTFLKFSLVGTVGFAVNSAIVEVLSIITGPVLAEAAAFPFAVTSTWLLNRQFTFRSPNAIPVGSELLRYAAANLGGWGINSAVYFIVLALSPTSRHYPVLAVAAGSVAGLFFNFATTRRYVFGHPETVKRKVT